MILQDALQLTMTSPKQRHHRVADRVRAHFGTPATVSSGVRCQAHNDELPGSSKNSYHVKGKAMDFCVRGVSGAKRVMEEVKRLFKRRRLPF